LLKERTLVQVPKNAMTCKNIGAHEAGDRYCTIEYRGFHLKFAGINAKGGGTIYVTALGRNQTVSTRDGGRCIAVAFGDSDLQGVIPAEVIFRDDAVITHTTNNR
jgi:hypothetical protein